jgi:hypothetical protein
MLCYALSTRNLQAEVVPVDIELRPLRLAEILDRVFQLYRARFVLFLGIAGVSTIIELLWNLINLAEVRWLNRSHLSMASRQSISSLSMIAGWAFVFAAAALCLAATNRALSAIYDGEPASIMRAFAALRSNWLRCIWLNTLAFLVAWGALILVLLGVVMATILAALAKTLVQANTLKFVYGATGLLVLAALPLCVWLTLRYSLAVPACVQEGLGTLRSLKRSVFLSKGTQGRILLLLLIGVSAQATVGVAFVAPVLALLAKTGGQASPAITAYILAATAVSSALIKPIYCIGLTLFYYDARVRKEGFDLERMLERSSRELTNEGVPSTGPTL